MCTSSHWSTTGNSKHKLRGLNQGLTWKDPFLNCSLVWNYNCLSCMLLATTWVPSFVGDIVQKFSRAGPRGRGREWATLGVHPLSWLLSNNRLKEVCSTLTKGTFSSRLLLSNQDKGCTPSVAHSLPLSLGPALLNLSSGNVVQTPGRILRIMT